VNRRCFCQLVGAAVICCRSARAGDAMINLYPADRLDREALRFERRIGELYQVLAGLIAQNGSDAELRGLRRVQTKLPLADPNGSPLNFYSQGNSVFMPVLSLLFLEDICTAYAWLDRHGYNLETIDEYCAMLQYLPASAWPGGRLPPPLQALGIPAGAVDEPEAGQLGLRLRNSAYAFVMAHELGHVLMGHPSYDKVSMEQARANEAAADAFALRVLEAAAEVPMGAVLYFQSASYMMPNPGLFAARGQSQADWEEAMRTWITHPLTSDRLEAIGLQLDERANRTNAPTDRETLTYISARVGEIAETLSDKDLQQCMAVAAGRANPSDLSPRPPGRSDLFLSKCVRR